MILFEIGTAQVKLQATPAASQYPGGAREGGHRPARVHLLLSRRGGAGGAVRRQGLSRAVVHRARRRRPRGDGARSREAVGGAGGAAGRAGRHLSAASRWASRRRTSRRAARSTARSSASRSCRRSRTPCSGATKYPFRHGDTTINVWSFGAACRRTRAAPAFSTSISNVEAVDARAKAESVQIDRPLGPVRAGPAHDLAVGSRRRHQLLRADHAAPPAAAPATQ